MSYHYDRSTMTRISRAGGAVLLVGMIAPGRALAQELYMTIEGRPYDKLSFVNPAGDVDFDGITDIVVTAQSACAGGGRVQIRSGADGGAVLPPVCGDHFNDALGSAIDGGGDFDGDGIPDFVAGDRKTAATLMGEVVVFSGKDASILATIVEGVPQNHFGRRVAFVGDVNLDGYDDVAAAGVQHPVHIYLGPNGTLLRTHLGVLSRPDVDFVGDVDGDGTGDYVIGWPQVNHGPNGFAGQVTVFSGRTGKPIHTVFGTSDWDHLGRSVAGVGDVDGDGIPDFAAGAPGEITPSFGKTRGCVRIFSGADASVLMHAEGPGPDYFELSNFGDLIDGGGDINGDGAGDLVVGGPNYGSGPFFKDGIMCVVSGRTGTTLWSIIPPVVSEGGRYQAVIGDLDGDGLAEFAHTERTAGIGNKSGLVSIFAGTRGDAERTCVSSPNSVGPGAVIGLEGPISVGNNHLALRVTGAVPGQVGQFFYGPQEVSQPFGDGVLCVGGGALGIARLRGPLIADAAGVVELPVDFTEPDLREAWRAGTTWLVQFGYHDPAGPGGTGFNFSDAMRITFTP